MKQAIVHFSGSTNSTLSAAILIEQGYHVQLLTYVRKSSLEARHPVEDRHRRLSKVYGDGRITRTTVSIDELHRRICYEGYISIARKYGLAVTALAFSKLAMHWHSARYATENSIATIADGTVPATTFDPDQDGEICLAPLRIFYEELGIEYLNPSGSINGRSEGILYDKGVAERPRVHDHGSGKHLRFAEDVFRPFFSKSYLGVHGRPKSIETLRALYSDRIDLIRSDLRLDRKAKNATR